MKEKDLLISELYKKGWKVEEIAIEAKCSTGTVYNALKRMQIPTRGGIPGIKDEIKLEVIRRYLNFESVNSIKNNLGITSSKINNILNQANINYISLSKRQNPNLIEDYFEKIDTPEKAYWLGWFITDGCFIDKDNSIQLSLQSSDKYILNLLEEDLGVQNKVKIFNKKYYRFYFSCKKLYNDLSKFGLVQNKTYIITIPEIPIDLYPHLLRGCFEGDGGLSILKTRGVEYELSFTGNLNCVTQFNNILSNLINIPPKNVTSNNNIFRVRWSNRNEILKIFEILYKDCGNHKLIRKYNKFLEIKGNSEVIVESNKSTTP